MSGNETGLITTVAAPPAIRAGHPSIFLDMDRFAAAQRVGQLLASSTLVPDHFRNNLGNCVIALNLAERLMVDPFMMMQTMYVVHGRPGIEGKLVIALIEGTGRFGPLEYKLTGSGKTAKGIDRPDSCVAFATELKSGKVIEGPPVTWAMAEAEGWLKGKPLKSGQGEQPSKWHTMPGMMFRYRAATFFARVHCPGALLGLRTQEELEDIVDLQEAAPGRYEAPDNEEPPFTPEESRTNEELLAEFNKAVPEGSDPAILEEFINRTAEANKVSPETLKIEAAKTGKIPELLKVFAAYQKQVRARATRNAGGKKQAEAAQAEAKETPAAETKMEPAPEAPKAEATQAEEGTVYKCPFLHSDAPPTKDVCEKCVGREECPEWERFK